MANGRDAIRWSPRVPKAKLRRLYRQEATGLLDDRLLDDVGMMLYLRCRDILAIHRAQVQMEVRCPRCDAEGRDVFIPRRKGRDAHITCPQCGWSIVWNDWRKSHRRRQLNPGGAVDAFQGFVDRWRTARDARSKMLAIDRVIHEFHYSLKDQPDRPTRPAGVNLIEGKLGDVVEFLDELSEAASDQALRANAEEWNRKYNRTWWPQQFDGPDPD